MISETITQKIQHLLAMAEHPNSNPNEAAFAMERAQELLLKHNVTRSQVIDNSQIQETPAGIGVIDRTEANGFSWKSILLNVLAKANLCYVIRTPHENKLHLFGTYDNVKAVLEMFDWIILQMIPMALKGYTDYKNQGGYESKRSWNTGFYYGVIETIKTRVTPAYQTFANGDGKSLVLYNDKALSTAVHKVFPYTTHSSRRVGGGYDGRIAGRIAGKNISFKESRKLSNRLSLGAG